jgi:cytochrome c peroxidase
MIARALAEFQISLTLTDAPIDRFARGWRTAMSPAQKRGALLFFGKANCASCHRVDGNSNEMFSDFQEHVVGIPQLVPARSNMQFDGPGANEDFGREQFTGNVADRYAFRTSPLRNVALQPAFMHDGAFTSLDAAIRYHLDTIGAAARYTPAANGVDVDLAGPIAPLAPILARLDPLVATPKHLSESQIASLVAFVRDGLLDPAARPERLRRLIPRELPSGEEPLRFRG